MGLGVEPKLGGQGQRIDVGVVMFGESLRLHYANDQARNYMERAGSRGMILPHKQDLRLEIIKLGTQIREQDIGGSDSQAVGAETRKTVRTKQGAFHLRASRVLDPSQRAGQQIMILIEDRLNARSSEKSPETAP